MENRKNHGSEYVRDLNQFDSSISTSKATEILPRNLPRVNKLVIVSPEERVFQEIKPTSNDNFSCAEPRQNGRNLHVHCAISVFYFSGIKFRNEVITHKLNLRKNGTLSPGQMRVDEYCNLGV
jgi:hypothetical protein